MRAVVAFLTVSLLAAFGFAAPAAAATPPQGGSGAAAPPRGGFSAAGT